MFKHDPNSRKVPGVPRLGPDNWDKSWTFRETFLSFMLDLENNERFREFGKAQHELVLEYPGSLPGDAEDWVAYQLQAVTADLRFLQGFLRFIRDEEESGSTDDGRALREEDTGYDRLVRLCRRIEESIGRIAGELDQEVGEWRFEEHPG